MRPAPRDLSLLSAEWQGCGVDAAVQRGARHLVESLFDPRDFVVMDAPADERLDVEDGVLGLASIAARTAATLEILRAAAPDRVFHVGGTCGAELAPVAWLNERYDGDLAVVWLDAHGDFNTPSSSPSGHFHGMVLRTLLGDGPAPLVASLRRPLRPAQVQLAATRDLDPPEARFIRDRGIAVTTCEALATPAGLVAGIRAAGVRHVYAHLDLDALDPLVFADSLMQTPDGLTPEAAAAVVAALAAAFDLVGLSVVEYVPRTVGGLETLRGLLQASGVRIGALATLG